MITLKKIRKTYYTLRQKIACYETEIFTESTIGKNPFGSGDATFITKYCAVTGRLKSERIYFENSEEIKKDIVGLCGLNYDNKT